MGESVEPDGEGFTEAYDAEVPRADMVKQGANGTPWLLVKSAQNAAAGGMFSPDAVEGLLAKAELSTAGVNDLPDSAFAYIEPGGGKDDEGKTTPRGKRHFPVHDAAHVRNALSRAPQSPFGDRAMPKIRAAAKRLGVEASSDVAKADGASDPGSPAWEAQDAARAQQAIEQLTSLRTLIQQLTAREAAEAGAGHLDDLDAALDLSCMDDALSCALQQLTAFAAREQAAATVSKAAPDPGDAVHDAITKLAGACGCPVCTGWIAGAKEQGARQEVAQPPVDANDGPAADQQAPRPAAPQPMPAGKPAAATPEQTMTKTADTADTADATAAAAQTDADALAKAQHKADKKARRAAVEAALVKATEKNTALETELGELRKRVETVESQPAQGSGPMLNGAQPGANPLAPAQRGQGADGDGESLLKAIAEEPDPLRKAELQERHVVRGLKEIFSKPPTVAPGPTPAR